ncbi:hypothetical protein SBOR_9869 [Sclerotinia borealis F-4128]|uniref:F-box domain-containing protein n=1 Tax=Sclerotinia borealis (strain F-4128) TaxID=1432307 RepID=W9BYR2_SCLBF|nr:hypothetical protein SBOR_9869 [Sclerotinia borealis F-4128]
MTIPPQFLQRYCPLDNGLLRPHAAKIPASISDIGSFKALPLEIIHLIFNLLDLRCLTDFRAVSWRARTLVDSVPEYNALVKHSPDALRALISTRIAVYFTAQDIFEALCTQFCAGCGQFGPFLDMFTAQRYCINCVGDSDDLLSMTASSARKEFGLNLKTMRTIPTLLSIPGEYAESSKEYRRRISLVRMLSASVAQSQIHKPNTLRRRSSPPVSISTQPPQPPSPPISHRLLQKFVGHKQDPYRFMPMLRVPYLDRRTGSLDWGVSCQACRLAPRDERRGYYDWNTVYSTPGYYEHFQKCEVSQRGRLEIPRHIKATAQEQRVFDARFLGFYDFFKF